MKLDNEALIMYVRPWGHVPVRRLRAAGRTLSSSRFGLRGWHRWQVSADDALAAMPMAARTTTCGPVRDVPAKPTMIEGEFDLKARQVIVFTGWSLPGMRSTPTLFKESLDKYTGWPGRRMDRG